MGTAQQKVYIIEIGWMVLFHIDIEYHKSNISTKLWLLKILHPLLISYSERLNWQVKGQLLIHETGPFEPKGHSCMYFNTKLPVIPIWLWTVKIKSDGDQ